MVAPFVANREYLQILGCRLVPKYAQHMARKVACVCCTKSKSLGRDPLNASPPKGPSAVNSLVTEHRLKCLRKHYAEALFEKQADSSSADIYHYGKLSIFHPE